MKYGTHIEWNSLPKYTIIDYTRSTLNLEEEPLAITKSGRMPLRINLENAANARWMLCCYFLLFRSFYALFCRVLSQTHHLGRIYTGEEIEHRLLYPNIYDSKLYLKQAHSNWIKQIKSFFRNSAANVYKITQHFAQTTPYLCKSAPNSIDKDSTTFKCCVLWLFSPYFTPQRHIKLIWSVTLW